MRFYGSPSSFAMRSHKGQLAMMVHLAQREFGFLRPPKKLALTINAFQSGAQPSSASRRRASCQAGMH